MIGIALAGWDRLGWRGGIAEFWMRLRDRKAVFASVVLTCAYICIVLTGLVTLADLSGLVDARMPSPLVIQLLALNAFMLVWRLLVRAAFVAQAQGMQAALLSIPRTLIANIISILAARRAVSGYAGHLLGRALQWDKTTHSHFPSLGPTTSNAP
jgi:adsorption protein B